MSAAARAPDHGDVGLGPCSELFVENPIDSSVLLYDGEELVGAKQNRILNVSVLVGAGAKLGSPSPASSRGAEPPERVIRLRAAHLDSHLRRRKAEMLPATPLALGSRREMSGTRCARSSRGWACAPRPRRTRTRSRRTLPGSRRSRRRSPSCARPVRRGPGPRGRSLPDGVSQPAFALLWPKLRAGYLLDALERLDGRATSVERIAGFVDDAGAAQATRGRRPGSARTCDYADAVLSAWGSSSTARRSSRSGVHERRRRRTGARAGSHGCYPTLTVPPGERVSSRGLDTRRPSRPSLGFASGMRAPRADREAQMTRVERLEQLTLAGASARASRRSSSGSRSCSSSGCWPTASG